MKEPERRPLDPQTPKPAEVQKIPMPSLATEENAEQAFLNFIQKAKESKKRYNTWVEEQKKKKPKDFT